ncbi:MAG: heme biosynthesis HemY N-terminal domain-containing protein [Acidiphilium sp.]
MLRAFRFGLIAIVVLAVIWGIAALPGTVRVDTGSYHFAAGVPVAILLLLLLAIAVIVLINVLRALLRAPRHLADRRAASRRDTGEIAAVRALSALASGDTAAARGHAKTAQRHAPDSPISLYVAGEAARQAGDHVAADQHFATLAQHKHAGFLGWRGLVQHHASQNDADSQSLAQAHVRLAAQAHPGSPWLREARVRLATARGDYAEAARLATAKTEMGALAVMASRQASDPTLAIDWAREAIKATPSLSIAYLALAAAHQRAGFPRAWHQARARAALRAGWRAAPHPEIAKAFLQDIEAPLERARAAQTLAELNPNHPESEKLLAETARVARLEGEAQRHRAGADQAGTRFVCSQCQAETPEWRHDCPRCGVVGSLVWTGPAPTPAPVTTPMPPSAQGVGASA